VESREEPQSSEVLSSSPPILQKNTPRKKHTHKKKITLPEELAKFLDEVTRDVSVCAFFFCKINPVIQPSHKVSQIKISFFFHLALGRRRRCHARAAKHFEQAFTKRSGERCHHLASKAKLQTPFPFNLAKKLTHNRYPLII
jgi:hypothetical protein